MGLQNSSLSNVSAPTTSTLEDQQTRFTFFFQLTLHSVHTKWKVKKGVEKGKKNKHKKIVVVIIIQLFILAVSSSGSIHGLRLGRVVYNSLSC